MEPREMQIDSDAYVAELELELRAALLELVKMRALVRTMVAAAVLEESSRQTDEAGELVEVEQ